MRIISQNNSIDLNYERCTIRTIENYNRLAAYRYRVLAYNEDYEEFHELGEYSTEENLNKVIESLRKQYSEFKQISIIHNGSESLSYKGSIDKLLYFKFPKDEEVYLLD